MSLDVHVAGKVPTGVLNEPGSILEADAMLSHSWKMDERGMEGRPGEECCVQPLLTPQGPPGTTTQLGICTFSSDFLRYHPVPDTAAET